MGSSRVKRLLVVIGIAAAVILVLVSNSKLYEHLLGHPLHIENNQFHLSSNSYKCNGKWMEWYKTFHANGLKSASTSRFLVFYCPGHDGGCGGYGNRMVGLVSTFYLSVLLNRVFMVHWGGPERFEAFLLPNQIDWTYDESKLRGLSTRSHYWGVSKPGGYDRKKIKSEENIKKWIKEIEPRILFHKQVVKLNTIWNIVESLWRNREFKKRARELQLPPVIGTHPYATIGCAMSFLFNKSQHLMKEFRKEKSRLGPRHYPMIGIHVRTSDHHWGSTNDKSYRTRAPERVFLCAQRVEKALKKKFISLRNKTFMWFLAADDTELKLRAQSEYRSNVVTLNIRPRHLDLSRDNFQKVLRDLLMDQLMLLECDFFLPTWDSTFSYVVLGLKQFSVKNFVFGENCVFDENELALAPGKS